MEFDIYISYGDNQEYNIKSRFHDRTKEIICFSYIIDQTLADTSTEHRKKTTLGNIAACFARSTSTWSDLKQEFGQFNKTTSLRKKYFTAKYKLVFETGFFGGSVDLEKEYRPRNPSGLDGKISVTTMLYAIHLVENTSSEHEQLIIDILEEQLDYYKTYGYPSVGNRGAPAEAVENVLRY